MIIKVLVELSAFKIDKTFSYTVPNELQEKIKVGVRVLVPFSRQTLEGFVLEICSGDLKNDNNEYELKDIISVIDETAILNEELLLIGKYVSESTLSTLISSYQVMLPKALKANSNYSLGIKKDCLIEIDNYHGELLSDKQQQIMDVVTGCEQILYSDLKKINTTVDTLIKNNILKKVYVEKYRLNSNGKIIENVKTLTDEQQEVYEEVTNNLNSAQTYLLYGVTGSGKTEVYIKIIDEVILNKKQALLLVPEITLTSQILSRLRAHFKRIAVLHSKLSDGERYDEYRRIKNNEVDVVIGTRSAIFAPLSNLGIIILDECHSTTYKQDNMPRYDSIDIAKYRSDYHHCPIILGSATPTLTMFAKAQKGIYKLLTLSKRAGKSQMPEIEILDLTREKRLKNTSFSEKLVKDMNEVFKRKEQVILLINRRGYANISMCQNCGYTIKCPSCDISLIYHKTSNMYRCHYCGYATNSIPICPSCHEETLKNIGTGTEKIEEELNKLFPEKRIVRMDLDTTSKKGSHERMIEDFANYKYDILLGTQMIAKGLDFPNVTLVGVITADNNLSIPSYRSSEETFDLLCQIAGRSGRSDKRGKVIIQTFNKDHYAIRYASMNDYLSFYKEEMKIRLMNKYPPYYYLVGIKVKSKDYSYLSKEVGKVNSYLRSRLSNSLVLDPTVCVPFKIKDVYRFGILIKYKKEDQLRTVLKELIDHYQANNHLEIEIDFNPHDI